VITFPATIWAGGTINAQNSKIKNVDVTGNFEVIIFVTNGNTYSYAWTNSVASLPNFTQIGVSLPTSPVFGNGSCTVTVRNIGDTDGYNAIWLDDLAIDGASPSWGDNFSTNTDANLTGDKEK